MADQSSISTQHIDAIISELTSRISKAVSSMKLISTTSEEQHNSVSDTIQKYHDISEAMKQSEKAVDELNSSEKDMEMANNEIKNMLQSLSAIAEQNASNSQQAASTMEEQTASVQVVAEVSDRLIKLAEDLRASVTKFKIV